MKSSNFDLSVLLKNNPDISHSQKLKFVWALSIPGIFAQISSILMQYIDAAMVGNLGANASASIGLVASSTWVIGSLSDAIAIGFTVQVAQAVGAGDQTRARNILFTSIKTCLLFSLILAATALGICNFLPTWLGGEAAIKKDAALYFMIFGISAPFYQMIYLMSGMLQCSGNMKLPSFLNASLCLLDALFNVVFIKFFHLGVLGAALGSATSAFLISLIIVFFTVFKSPYLNLRHFTPSKSRESITKKAIKLASPIALEKVAFTGALVVVTKIIAPLGAVALAANSFAVTAEALCYMPGYGIQEAATTLVGQSAGAKRKDLVRSFSWITVFSGMLIMTLTGILMYFICPFVFQMLTPVTDIQALAIQVLRIEIFAEPFYGASIVCNGALRGQNDTLIPSILNLISLWIVRLGLSLLLVGKLGLIGIWIAMAVELTFRGCILLSRLAFINYKHKQ